jgi:hypothetical protein
VTNALAARDFAVPGLDVPPSVAAPYPGRESALGVLCSDDPNPRVPALYPAQAAYASARSGVVGPYWAWIAEVCARWPVLAPQRYTGPWNRPTARPILVVGNTVDPATPYQGAVAMSHDLADARLLTVRGYGHTALGNHSSCVDAVESGYFVTGALPPRGTVCHQDQPRSPGDTVAELRSATELCTAGSSGFDFLDLRSSPHRLGMASVRRRAPTRGGRPAPAG